MATRFAQLTTMCIENKELVFQGAVWCKISLTPVKVSIFIASQDCNGIYENILLLHFNIYGFAFHAMGFETTLQSDNEMWNFQEVDFRFDCSVPVEKSGNGLQLVSGLQRRNRIILLNPETRKNIQSKEFLLVGGHRTSFFPRSDLCFLVFFS